MSIGHSNLDLSVFIDRLKWAGVTAIADVRSSPFSRNYPQFNRHDLQRSLLREGIAYVFLGKELGGRPDRPELYSQGVADYEKMAKVEQFSIGLDRVQRGAKTYRIALMCSERSPLDCHRCLLVGRALQQRGAKVRHIISQHRCITQEEVERELLQMFGGVERDMFVSDAKQIADAYRARARKVAYSQNRIETTADIVTEHLE